MSPIFIYFIGYITAFLILALVTVLDTNRLTRGDIAVISVVSFGSYIFVIVGIICLFVIYTQSSHAEEVVYTRRDRRYDESKYD